MSRLLFVSLPDDLAEETDALARSNGQDQERVVRDALRRQVQLQRFASLQRYGRERAEERGSAQKMSSLWLRICAPSGAEPCRRCPNQGLGLGSHRRWSAEPDPRGGDRRSPAVVPGARVQRACRARDWRSRRRPDPRLRSRGWRRGPRLWGPQAPAPAGRAPGSGDRHAAGTAGRAAGPMTAAAYSSDRARGGRIAAKLGRPGLSKGFVALPWSLGKAGRTGMNG